MADPSSTVLLSGASGMIGQALGAALGARGIPVIRLVRHTSASAAQIQWDPSAEQPIAEDSGKLEGIQAAIHLSGANVSAHRWTPAYKARIRDSRLRSTRALAKSLAGLSQPPRALLVASATGIYGDRGDEVLNEASAPGSGFLAGLCCEWEAAAEVARVAGICVVHLRFGIVLAPEGGALSLMTPIFRLGLGGRLGSGRQWMSWIALADLVAAVLFVLDAPTLAGPVNFTAPQPVTNAGFTRTLARTLRRPAILPAPAFALRLALGQMADEALLASARVVPDRLTSAGFAFRYPDLASALKATLG